MGRGQPTSRTPNYTTELEVLLETKNDRIAELEATIKRVEDAVASHEEGLGDMVVAEIALALAGEAK